MCRRQRWQGDAEAVAEVDGGIVGGLAIGMSPEIQSVAGATALEAVENLLVQVDREATAGAGTGAVQRARAA